MQLWLQRRLNVRWPVEEQNNQMLRKSRYDGQRQPQLAGLKHSDSASTQGSDSPRCSDIHPPPRPLGKEKLELCKKFMEFGFCPYRNRCKFAHGCHELRRDNQKNRLYKTKQCVGFFQDGHCPYGDRCNFKHSREGAVHSGSEQRRKQAWENCGEVLREGRGESRLLQLLRLG